MEAMINELIALCEMADNHYEQALKINADFAAGHWLGYSAALHYVLGNLQELKDSGVV